jgi:hypothetical protein
MHCHSNLFDKISGALQITRWCDFGTDTTDIVDISGNE